ncbi:Sodium/calcium exchanger protein-domain-containing protein [Phascolomyces articulosus]|uniref:Sodium/calcium exchanger protein-domain-containing protein n=1 Tax=Phascolomyces articulosus TaxID=60185 RepID=A0AAD5PBZ0_9FUNG|nr:Sodium/calcium exchanger protein-domain-containing protein [Phascolomyces articulosus]
MDSSEERRPSIQKSQSSSRRRPSTSSSRKSQYGSTEGGTSARRRKSTLKRRSTLKRNRSRRHRHRHDSSENETGVSGEGSSEDNSSDNDNDDNELADNFNNEDLASLGSHTQQQHSKRIRRPSYREGVSFSALDHEVTLKDKQEAMNRDHPFGMPIWKPALYRKSRSVVRKANHALHLYPSSSKHLFLNPGNILWTLVFGWWLALVMLIIAIVLRLVPPHGRKYWMVMSGLSFYLLWPFGRYVERVVVEDIQDHDEEAELLIPKQTKHKQTWKEWIVHVATSGLTGWVYYFFYLTLIGPLLFIASTICWMCVITIPMAKLNYKLVRHLMQHPLTMRFHSSPTGVHPSGKPTVILLCTYQAIGFQYYKYTYEGVNIIFINLISLVLFVIFDEYVIHHHFPDSFIASPMMIFTLSLGSVIPLSYFIGMGISSVSAQTSMAVGSVINATFGSIIEIILYAIALMGGKSALVEGSLIGSILVGVLLLPGCAMVSGGIKKKEQKFNAKSAGVTSTMLIMALIGALSPTLFYQMFGSFELKCAGCPGDDKGFECSQCHYDQLEPANDPVYQNSVKPFMWICAIILPSAYIIGLVFSLHTHNDVVWKSPTPQDSAAQQQQSYLAYYQKLFQSYLNTQSAVQQQQQDVSYASDDEDGGSQYKRRAHSDPSMMSVHNGDGPAGADNHYNGNGNGNNGTTALPPPPPEFIQANDDDDEDEEVGGHDAPEWSTAKSFTVLFACTLLYSIIAEILVDTVDLIMADMQLDEKFLGLTLFALVPNITEFTNAIGFSIHGNIVLSMEIGSAYALQVCLLQIPAMVAFSLWYNWGKEELAKYTFSLIFPHWDVIAVILSVFLLTYTYQEGKSNYFKGSILILSYLVLVAGFFFIPTVSEKQNSFTVGLDPALLSKLVNDHYSTTSSGQ